MAVSRGKDFERKFKEDWMKEFGEGSIDRLYDPTNGFKAISNISDFITYSYPFIYYLECKSTKGNTFSIPFRQYEKLLKKKGLRGVFAGIVIWFIEKEKIVFVDIEETERLISAGYKSINCDKMVGKEGFKVIEIPSVLKRTFLSPNLKIMYEYMVNKDKENNNGK